MGTLEPYQLLEQCWAEFNGLDPEGMVVCSSGTAALHLALECLPVECVFVPDFTMVACARAVVLADLELVLVDCREDLLVDPDLVWEHAKEDDCAMAVHVYGRQCAVDALAGCVRWIVEDLAEAHGVRPHPLAAAACWSFYRNKIVAGEEGGAAWFRDPEHAKLARSLRSLGFTDAHDFTHLPRGHNYRMSNLHAEAVLCGRNGLNSYAVNLKERRDIEGWYGEFCPGEWLMPERDAPWVYDLRVRGMTGEKQDELVLALRAEGIAARHGFKPMSRQDEFRSARKFGGDEADVASREVVYLPIQPGVTTRGDCHWAMSEMMGRALG